MAGIDKRDKRGLEMAISTLIIIILSVIVLLALVLAFTGGFTEFWKTIKSYSQSDIQALKKTCENSCAFNNNYDFCCLQREIDFGGGTENLTCQDSRLKVECKINCQDVC